MNCDCRDILIEERRTYTNEIGEIRCSECKGVLDYGE